ncbi:hypothetical protein ACFW08_05030 [Streptomyces sp. NPDC058960]|uniref:hypothetical protein n=1 Tax=Streptomyces sp. NPDC058960 TaxID=3346679 RepID=UPI0036AE1E38
MRCTARVLSAAAVAGAALGAVVPSASADSSADITPRSVAPGDTVTVSVSCDAVGAGLPDAIEGASQAFEGGRVRLHRVHRDDDDDWAERRGGVRYRGTARVPVGGSVNAVAHLAGREASWGVDGRCPGGPGGRERPWTVSFTVYREGHGHHHDGDAPPGGKQQGEGQTQQSEKQQGEGQTQQSEKQREEGQSKQQGEGQGKQRGDGQSQGSGKQQGDGQSQGSGKQQGDGCDGQSKQQGDRQSEGSTKQQGDGQSKQQGDGQGKQDEGQGKLSDGQSKQQGDGQGKQQGDGQGKQQGDGQSQVSGKQQGDSQGKQQSDGQGKAQGDSQGKQATGKQQGDQGKQSAAQPPVGAQHGVHAGEGGAFTGSVPTLAAGGLLIAGALGAAVHRLWGRGRSGHA